MVNHGGKPTKAQAMTGYYQFIEGHRGNFMFALRAGNHETILESGVYWSRQATLDAIVTARSCSQDQRHFVPREGADGSHYFELRDASGKLLGRSVGCSTRGGLAAGMASVRRNAPSTTFRGLIRRDLDAIAAAALTTH
jgi:uncharacterized protein YegP (UPF0339 family)